MICIVNRTEDSVALLSVSERTGDDGGTGDHWSNPNDLSGGKQNRGFCCVLLSERATMVVQAIIGAIQMIVVVNRQNRGFSHVSERTEATSGRRWHQRSLEQSK
jgi:Flp pilus assembly CpaF family ATPase